MDLQRGTRFGKAAVALFALQLLAQEALAFSPSASVVSLRKRTQLQRVSPLHFFSKNTEEAVATTKQKATEEENTTGFTIPSAWNDWFVSPQEDEDNENEYNKVTKESDVGSFGLLQMINTYTQPVQEILDDSSSGWALSYANLKPDTSQTPAGQAFLATNLAYLLTGLALQMAGEVTLGTFTDLCAFASFQYHYQQLEATSDTSVRLALLLDYVCAALAMGTATIYLTGSVLFSNMVLDDSVWIAMAVTASSLGFLGLSWKYEYGRSYMWWHSLWHLTSACSGFLIGNLHVSSPLM